MDNDKEATKPTIYKLPKGEVKLAIERIQTPECMFTPSKFEKQFDGIQKFTYDSIMKCDADIRGDLFKGIVLAGGSTMFKGMKERMKRELVALAPSPLTPEVEAPADRKFS